MTNPFTKFSILDPALEQQQIADALGAGGGGSGAAGATGATGPTGPAGATGADGSGGGSVVSDITTGAIFGSITAFADNGSGGTTVSTTGPSPSGTATISGTTNYNNIFTVSNVVASTSFDINTAFVADDATGIYTQPLTLTESFADVYVITSGGSQGVETINLPGFGAYADVNVGAALKFILKTVTNSSDRPQLVYGVYASVTATQPITPFLDVSNVVYTLESDGQYWFCRDSIAAYDTDIGSPLRLSSGFMSTAEGGITVASGGFAHAEGSGTVASGIQSHAEGLKTTASGNSSHAEGWFTTAIDQYSHAEGWYTTAGGIGEGAQHAEGDHTSAIGNVSHTEGQYTLTTGNASHAEGIYSTDRGIFAAHVEGAFSFTTQGDAQCMSVKLGHQTTDATPTVLTADLNAPSLTPVTNQVVLPDNASYFCEVTVTGKVVGQSDYFVQKLECVIQRGTGAASTAIPITTPTTPAVISTYATAGAISGTWGVALSADTTNGALAVTVTGAVGATINWLAEVRTRELVF